MEGCSRRMVSTKGSARLLALDRDETSREQCTYRGKELSVDSCMTMCRSE